MFDMFYALNSRNTLSDKEMKESRMIESRKTERKTDIKRVLTTSWSYHVPIIINIIIVIVVSIISFHNDIMCENQKRIRREEQEELEETEGDDEWWWFRPREKRKLDVMTNCVFVITSSYN